MKILIVNSYDTHGGAAIAAYRLNKALINSGIDSKMIVQKKFSTDESVLLCENEWEERNSFYDKMPLLNYPQKTSTLFSSALIPNNSLINYINTSDIDIVHLHWVADGYLSIEDIGKIKKPIVWSLHDMWAFTGGCHYNENCKKYEKLCGYCKVLKSSKNDDLSRKNFKQKQNIFKQKPDLTIISLSNWIGEHSRNSLLLKNKKHINLPNPIDTNIFKPINKKKAREFWNLPKEKKLILFGAIGATTDPRKGFKELTKAINKLVPKDIAFVIFGSNKSENFQDSKIPTYYLGNLDNDLNLVKLYNAVDVMIVPSLQENLSNAIMESLSCGTPVVAFNIGGNSDMIVHQENGYLAKPFDIKDLRKGIEWILNTNTYQKICMNAREKIIKEFDNKVITKKYILLYKSILENKNYNHILNYRPNHKIKFITPEIENWLKKLAKTNLKYVVYGYGTFAEAFKDYFSDQIIAFIDQKSDYISTEIIKGKCYSPKNLININYDKIIISVIGREQDITEYLINELKININKIVIYSFEDNLIIN